MSDTVEKRFKSYDWDNSQLWKLYLNNLTFPEYADKDALLEKFKIRWYNNNIEAYQPPTEVSSQKTSPNQSTTTASTSSDSASSVQNSGNINLGMINLLLSAFILFSSVFGIFSESQYRYAILISICNYLLYLFRTYGLSLSLLSNLPSDMNGAYLLLSIVHLDYPRDLLFSNILTITSFYYLYSEVRLSTSFFRSVITGQRQGTIDYPTKIMQFVDSIQPRLTMTLVMIELILTVKAAIAVIFMFSLRSLMHLLLLYRFIQTKKTKSREMTMLLDFINSYIIQVIDHPSCPTFVKSIYNGF